MASIIQRLASRSITGRDLGIDAHKHHDELLHLFWKERGTEKCYTHVLERRFLEPNEYKLLQKYIYSSGFPNTCHCLSLWLPNSRFPTCPFLTSGPSGRSAHDSRRRLSLRACEEFNYCKCPEVFLVGCKANVTVTIFCLNRHSKLSSKVPHSNEEWFRARGVLVKHTRVLGL